MRKIILDLTLTLDGFIEGPNGEIDWIVDDQTTDFGDILNGILEGIDTIFYGRVSYDLWGNYSPGIEASEKLRNAYARLHSKKKYVFSNTKKDDAHATIISGDLKKEVDRIRRQPGDNIWLYGGASLVTDFINQDLIDQYRLSIQPVILGKGKALFQDIERRSKLQLIGVQKSDSGVVQLKYERLRP